VAGSPFGEEKDSQPINPTNHITEHKASKLGSKTQYKRSEDLELLSIRKVIGT
jgi:hypothetical protein